MDKLLVLSILMGLLLVASLFQAVELNGLKANLAKTSQTVKTGVQSQPQAQQSQQISSLPNMVGGC